MLILPTTCCSYQLEVVYTNQTLVLQTRGWSLELESGPTSQRVVIPIRGLSYELEVDVSTRGWSYQIKVDPMSQRLVLTTRGWSYQLDVMSCQLDVGPTNQIYGIKVKSGIPTLVDDDKECTTDSEKAEIMSSHFASQCSLPPPPPSFSFSTLDKLTDGIGNHLLKQCSSTLAKPFGKAI